MMASPQQPPKPASSQRPVQQTAAGSVTTHPPQVDGFKIKGSFKGTVKDISNVLRSISFLEIAPEKNLVNVVYVESRDISKNPYLFSIVKIKEDELEVLYSIPPEISPKKRRVDVISYLLNILSLIDVFYSIDNKAVFQLLETAVKDLTGSITMDYTKLYTSYDTMKKDVDDYKKKVERLNEQNQALTSKNYELKTQNDEIKLRLAELENLSDESLRVKLQEWITEHNGAINITEFSKLHKVAEGRAEEMLNRLVSEGYLETMD